MREAKEETGLKLKELRQFHSYSDPRRDPRRHTISTVFTARGEGKTEGGRRCRGCGHLFRRRFAAPPGL